MSEVLNCLGYGRFSALLNKLRAEFFILHVFSIFSVIVSGSKSDQLEHSGLSDEYTRGLEWLRCLVCISFIYLFCTSCQHTKKEDTLSVFAAASLGDVIRELGATYEQTKGVKLRYNFGSSGTLARQIAEGAPADFYISANKKWADYLKEAGSFGQAKIEKLAQNRLVMIAPKNSQAEAFEMDSSLNLLGMLADSRLSLGDPKHVPAGLYARQALEHFDLYKEIEPHILPGKDVRTALMIVELGEAALGVVYQTDAHRSEKVRVLTQFPQESHDGIYYYAGICSEKASVKDFMTFLVSEEAKDIWQRYGFE